MSDRIQLDGIPPEEGQYFGTLTWSTRLQFFVVFTVMGFVANGLSWVVLYTGLYWKYAILVTLGNIMSLAGSAFLMGPKSQIEQMFDDTRRTASLMYIGMMILTIVVAIVFHSPILCGFCCFAQYCAFIWYSLSYIPYGRDILTACLSSVSKSVCPV